jgi:hypothetical protein
MFVEVTRARRIDVAEASLSRRVAEATARRSPLAGTVFVRLLAGGVAICRGSGGSGDTVFEYYLWPARTRGITWPG